MSDVLHPGNRQLAAPNTTEAGNAYVNARLLLHVSFLAQ